MIRRNAARKRHEGARALCLAALVVAIVLSACTGENESVVVLGSLDDIEMGSVRTFHDVDGDSGRWEELPAGATETEPIPVDLHVVRYRERPPGQEGESEVLGVFLGRDPHSGCPVTWEADRDLDGRTGWFVAGCTGSIFDRDGVRVFGPSPRDLDRFSPLVDDGILSVDLDALLIGEDRTSSSEPRDSTPTPEATPTPLATEPASRDGATTADGVFIPYPPDEMRWMDKDGFIAVGPYDDRNLKPEEKAADPLVDPRWPDFVECMDAAGFGDNLPAPDLFRQDDLDRLVEAINEGGPFLEIDASGPRYIGTPASDAFMHCAQTVLSEPPR